MPKQDSLLKKRRDSKGKKPKINGTAYPKPSPYLDPDYEAIQTALEHQMSNIGYPQQYGSFHPPTSQPSGFIDGGNGSSYVVGGGCSHIGDTVVFEQDDKALFAASWTGLKEFSDNWDLVIDLAGNCKPHIPASVPSVWDLFIKPSSTFEAVPKLNELTPKPIVTPEQNMTAKLLSLGWPDMGIPPVGLDFWQTLWDELPARTVIACQGGHGRTGTCLAAFMITAGYDYWTAFETVRKEHCKKAIESLSQEIYLHKLYMRRLNEELTEATLAGAAADVKDLTDDLLYAQAHIPSNAVTLASKGFSTPSQVNSMAMAYGKPVAHEYRNNVRWEKCCIRSGCSVYACVDPEHLDWVKAHVSADTTPNWID